MILDDILQSINRDRIRVNIIGHTDNIGSDSMNTSLSKRRANNVKQVLIDLGVENISTSWEGESKPRIVKDKNYSSRYNRRVEIVILKIRGE